MNGDQFNVNPQARNNMTVLYAMGDKFMAVGELNQTVFGSSVETYVETIYIFYQGVWKERIRRTDCRLTAPETLRSNSLNVTEPPRTASLQFRFQETQEGLSMNFTCNERGIDTWFNKMSASPDAQLEGPLEWELQQPGYGGNCLICNLQFYQGEHGEIPRLDPHEMETVDLDGRSLTFDNNGDGSAAPGAFSTAIVIATALILALF